MEKREPTLVPEWLKGANGGGVTSSGTVNHTLKSLSFSDRTPSYCKNVSNNDFGSEKDKSKLSRRYSSFGQSYHDRDQEKDIGFCENERPLLIENGYYDHFSSSKSGRLEKDPLWRSNSVTKVRQPEARSKRPGRGTNDGVLSVRSLASSIRKTSFDKDFPSLGADERQVSPDASRVSSPGPTTAVQNLPIGSSAMIGGDGWTSALVDVPSTGGVNVPLALPGQQSIPSNLLSAAPSMNNGLNMAETLAQAPLRSRTAPQLSGGTQKLEELAIKQSRQLIPMVPSTPKAMAFNSSEKLKLKPRTGDMGVSPKAVLQSLSQSVSHVHSGSGRSDVKTSHAGNFQVLNREKNGFCSAVKEVPTSSAGRNGTFSAVPFALAAAKIPNLQKLNTDSKTSVMSGTPNFGDRKPSSQAKDRIDFFNSLRKKTSGNHLGPSGDQCLGSPVSEKSGDHVTVTSATISETRDTSASNSGLVMIDSVSNRKYNTSEESESQMFPSETAERDASFSDVAELTEEEKRFLRSLGWVENDECYPLTPEEIETFEKNAANLVRSRAGYASNVNSFTSTVEFQSKDAFCGS